MAEYRVVDNDKGKTSIARKMNALADEGWRYVDTLEATRWTPAGSHDSRLGLVVLMGRDLGEPGTLWIDARRGVSSTDG